MKKETTRKKKPYILPMVASQLIDIALTDLEEVERLSKDPNSPIKYDVDMGNWYEFEKHEIEGSSGRTLATVNVCSVCFAGAVMAMRLNLNPENETTCIEPYELENNREQLQAINELREGNVRSALLELDVEDPEVPQKILDFAREIPDYDVEDTKPFHKAMRQLQKDLEKLGY